MLRFDWILISCLENYCVLGEGYMSYYEICEYMIIYIKYYFALCKRVFYVEGEFPNYSVIAGNPAKLSKIYA